MNRDGTNKHRLVRNGVADFTPAWSPDGKTIAFVSNAKLYLVDAGGGEPRRLESPGVDWEQGLHWSPDGNRIAFVDCRADYGSDLYIIDKDGQNLIRIESSDRASVGYPHWSPDGSQLAYISTLDPLCSVPSRDYPNSLMIADAQDPFHVRKIADQFPLGGLMWMDQETLSYTGRPEGEIVAKPYIINLKSGLQTKIRTDRDGAHYTWAPDGTALAYSADTGTSNVVYVQDRSSGRGTSVWELTHALIHDVAWSPNSQWLLINIYEELPPTTTHAGGADSETIWVISRDGTFAQRVTPLMPGGSNP